ncbi:CU044_2847 family protein [Streptomyces sp. NPDC050804]|uniref:CU044_2847 family protein n=1 Tax=Streptomyces sp. NPDC050804 TaxID=3154745 RepID=UPI00341DBB6F
MTVIVGPTAPGEDGPIPVVVDTRRYEAVPAEGLEAVYDAVYEDEDTRDGAARRVLQVARDSYGEGLDLARRCASQAMRRLGDLGEGLRPDEIELQVSITLDAGMAAVVKAGAEAQLQITFRWQPGGAGAAPAGGPAIAPEGAPAGGPVPGTPAGATP